MSNILYHSSSAFLSRFALAEDAEDENALGVWFFPTWEAAMQKAGTNGVVHAAHLDADGTTKALNEAGFEDMQKKAFAYAEGAGVYYQHLREKLAKDGVARIDVVDGAGEITKSVVLDVEALKLVDRRYTVLSHDEASRICLELDDAAFRDLHLENQHRVLSALRSKSEAMKVEAADQVQPIKERLSSLNERRAPISKRLEVLAPLHEAAWLQFVAQFERSRPAPVLEGA